MVTKLEPLKVAFTLRSVLAKIHMVTKLVSPSYDDPNGSVKRSVLAKIHMVTKQTATCPYSP